MSVFTTLGVDIASPVDAAGNSRAVNNGEMQVWMTEAESVMNAFTSTGGLIYSAKTAIDADLAHGANSMAWVLGDATVANNGIYMKVGASGAGSWTRLGDLPYSFIAATNVGSGTADAILATTAIPLPAADAAALITLNITANNTGAATVAFNGGAALTIKTNAGADVAAAYLADGQIVLGVISGSTFRLFSEVSGAAYQAAAEAAASAAVAAASTVVSTQSSRAYATANYQPTIAPDFIQTAGYASAGDGGAALYKKVVSEPSHAGKMSITLDDDVTVVWYEIAETVLTPWMLGAAGDGATDDTAALQSAVDIGRPLMIPKGNAFFVEDAVVIPSGAKIFGGGKILAGDVDGFTTNDFASAWGVFLITAESDFSIDDIEFDISAWDTLPAATASLRCLLIRRCTDFRISNCKATTTGGFVACVGCSDFEIVGNNAICVQPGSEDDVFADGVIDCWVEFNLDTERAVIANNRIRGNDYARWGIMLTGLEYMSVDMKVHNFVIDGNVITDTTLDGIWIFGRDGGLDGTVVSNNTIDTARKGIAVSDANDFAILGNIIRNTDNNGIELFSEGTGDGAGCQGGMVNDNKLSDVAASMSGTPSGIYIQGASQNNTIAGNAITGTTHYYGIFTGTSSLNNRIAGNKIVKGRGVNINQTTVGNLIDGAPYTPTLTADTNVASSFVRSCDFYAYNDRVVVYFDLSITPTAGGSADTRLDVTLPVPSDMVADSLFGSGVIGGSGSVSVFADATNEAATVRFAAPGTGAQIVYGSFSYRIA